MFPCALIRGELAALPRNTKTAQRARRKGSTWFLGSWNVRSLLDYEGPVETARQYAETGQFDDCRIDQVVKELERYIQHFCGCFAGD